MKYLKNKVFIEGSGEMADVTAAELVKAVVEQPKAGGINVAEMRKALKVLEAIEGKKEGDMLAFEDVDAAFLKQEVASFKWARLNKGVVEFCDAVDNMPSKLKEKVTAIDQ